MSESAEGRVSHPNRPPVALIIFALFIGLSGLFRVMGSPHFESYRTMDVVQLLVSGAAIGVALMGLMMKLLLPRHGPQAASGRATCAEAPPTIP
jgi:hypothetical protein